MYLYILTIVSISLSCGKDFGDINLDPNNPGKVTPDALMTGAQKLIAENVFTGFPHARQFAIAEYLSQSWTQNNYTELCRYDIKAEYSNAIYNVQYAGILYDLKDIETILLHTPGIKPAQDKNKLATARILRVYTLQLLTDLFGPIPYSQALLGNTNRTPEYMHPKEVYTGIMAELESALDLIDVSEKGFETGDVLYQGDMSKWKKFGYTLWMRIAMRMSDVEPTLSREIFQAIWEKGMTATSDNAMFSFLKASPNDNPLYRQRLERGNVDQGLSDILIDKTLKPLNDPRLPLWAEMRIRGGGYYGRPYGQESSIAAEDNIDNYSHPSGSAQAISRSNNFNPQDVIRPDFSACVLGYAEYCFMLAEAIERAWMVDGTAAYWYQEGIRASMNEWGIFDNQVIDNYLNQDAVQYTTAPGNWKQKIGVQKWLAFFMQGFQAWIEWRRLDFNKLERPVNGPLGDIGNAAAPMRLIYPTDEQSLNSKNYNNALQLLGGPDKMSTKVWWDIY